MAKLSPNEQRMLQSLQRFGARAERSPNFEQFLPGAELLAEIILGWRHSDDTCKGLVANAIATGRGTVKLHDRVPANEEPCPAQ